LPPLESIPEDISNIPIQPKPTPPSFSFKQPPTVSASPVAAALSDSGFSIRNIAADIDQKLENKTILNRGLKDDVKAQLNMMVAAHENLLKQYKDSFEADVEEYEKVKLVSAFRNVQQEFDNRVEKLDVQLSGRRDELAQITSKLEEVRKELIEASDASGLQSVSLYKYYNPAENSAELKSKLDRINDQIKQMIRDKTAVNAAGGFNFNNSAAQGKKFVKDFAALMLTAYNQEAENAIVKAERGRDIMAALNRLDKAAEKIKTLGSLMDMSVNISYHRLRRQEIELTFQYKEQVYKEKEEERERKAEMREEERAEREARKRSEELLAQNRAIERQIAARKAELEAERQAGLQKEGAQLANAISFLAEDDPVLKDLLSRQGEVKQAQNKASDLLANLKAGYVYVISNIGAFGEGVVKIGMTRRAVPEERIKELGDASVPFSFDAHILHYSNDAVGLEHALHQKFAAQAINKVNSRKEFFRVHPSEVRDAMTELSHGAILSFELEPIAADNRSSLMVK
jgi:DNA-binding protein